MSNIIKRDFHGIQIAFEGKEKASLTDMWKAAGSPANQEPWRWAETEQAKNFIPAVMQKYNLAKNEVMKTTRGGGRQREHKKALLRALPHYRRSLHGPV